jgi:predicted metal-dependent phosphoesterase TrpH
MSRIDLHTHTTASDGSLSPTELVQLAKQQGVSALAVTDHDSVTGLPDAMAAGEQLGVTIIPGIEISCLYEDVELHILGYFINPDDPRLRSALLQYLSSREDRNPQIIERLCRLGLDLTYLEVRAFAGSATVGRPHIAQILLQKGYVTSVGDAFDRYLADGAPAYVSRALPAASEAIGLIREIGGVPVLAHPVYAARLKQTFNETCANLKALGLAGLETLYSSHTQRQTDRFRSLAHEHGLLVTGGSDFHGDSKPDILVGTGYGNLKVSAELLEPVQEAAKTIQGPRN